MATTGTSPQFRTQLIKQNPEARYYEPLPNPYDPAWHGTKHVTGVVKGVDVARRRFDFIASFEQTDRHGEIVSIAGLDTTDYERNPVLLDSHDHGKVIGKTLALKKRSIDGTPALTGTAEMLPPGIARVDEAWSLIKSGALSAVSIGFMPLKKVKDTFTASSLLELSAPQKDLWVEITPMGIDAVRVGTCWGCTSESLGRRQHDAPDVHPAPDF